MDLMVYLQLSFAVNFLQILGFVLLEMEIILFLVVGTQRIRSFHHREVLRLLSVINIKVYKRQKKSFKELCVSKSFFKDTAAFAH